MVTRLILSLALSAVSANVTAMEGAATKKVKLEEKLTAQQLIRPVAEVHIVLTDEDAAAISAFEDVICQGNIRVGDLPVLSLADNNLSALPRGFENLTALTRLILRNNPLTTLFQDRWLFPQLEELDISHTRVGKAVIEWSGISDLRKLQASNAGLKRVDDTICNLSQLRFVDVSHNQLGEISPMLLLRSTLEYLNYCANRLTTLSAMICNLDHLRELHLDANGLRVLPKEIGRLPLLQVLSVNNNQLLALPDEIGKLANLRVLRLAGNQLCVFPQAVCALSTLEELYLDANKLETLSDGLKVPDLAKLSALTIFSLAHNALRELPHGIVFLERLKKLILSHNRFVRIPWEAAKLTALEELAVDHNLLEAIPDSLTGLINLRKVSIGYNQLPDLEGVAQALRKTIKVVITQSELLK